MECKLFLGIDFGTSTNYITKYDFSKHDAIEVENMGGYGESNIFANSIYIESENSIILGAAADKRAGSDPMNYFRDIKRYVTSDNWKKRIPNLDNKLFSAAEICQLVFSEIRRKVEKIENKSIDGVVITVPYSYGYNYRKRIKKAAESAGLNVLMLVEEPVAAAISYGMFSDPISKSEKVLVFDFGGGTLDITVFNFSKNSSDVIKIEVLNTDGLINLGGRDIDEILSKKYRRILELDYDQIENETERKKFQNKLLEKAVDHKIRLSSSNEIDVYENFTVSGDNYELEFDLARQDFNQWLKLGNIIGEIEDALDRCLMDIKEEDVYPEDIDKILLAGGTSSIPLIYETIKNYFGKELESKKNLDELVGHGAGIIAGHTMDKNLGYEINRKTSKNIGVARANSFIPILDKNTQYGVLSSPYTYIANNNNELKIVFYEGDSTMIETCENIGFITIDSINYEDEEINITLSRDENEGFLQCFCVDKNNRLIDEFVI